MFSTTDCGACLRDPPPFEHTLASFQYDFPIINFIAQLKFHHNLVAAKLLGELLANYISENKSKNELPQCIIPIPLHINRLKERGFNQALEIAKPVSKKLKIPLIKNICSRTKETKPQAKLNANERKKNIKNAFSLNKNVHLEHIAILDDVVTTTNTVRELSLLFKNLGVKTIEIWSCARAK